jgi:chemotaxis protein MotB
MARREKPPEPGAPLWMCTYGDLMSLLLCFFIMLFAISIIAPIRFQAVADTLSQDFTGYSGSSRTKARNTKTVMIPADSAAKSHRISEMLGGQPNPGPAGGTRDVHTILLDGETVRGGVIRFQLGRDVLTDQSKQSLRTMLPLLQGSPFKILVKGRATPTEWEGEYSRDTDLAYFRALNTVNYLVELGLKQEFFEIVVDPSSAPSLNLLPPGTDVKNAEATVEIILLNQTLRSLRD